MNKWYRSCKWMLVAALAVQMSGCAQQASWLSRVTGRGNDDRKLVEVEGKKKAGSATVKKSSTTKSSKDSTDKSTDSQLAEKSPTKPKSSSSLADSIRSEVASAKEPSVPKRDSTVAKTAKRTAEATDPFLMNNELDALEATASKKIQTRAVAARKAVASVASVDPFAEDDSEPTIEQASATGSQKRSPAAAPDFETGSRVREVAQQAEDDLAKLVDLPEWGIDEGAAQAKTVAKQATQTAKTQVIQATSKAATNANKVIRSAEQVRHQLETTLKEPAPASPVAADATKSGTVQLLSLCPAAEGELRDQIRALETNDVEGLKRGLHQIGRMGTEATAAAPALTQLLKHKDGFVRTHAALALARMQQSPPEAIQTVVDGLKSSDPGQRSFAAAALAEMGPQAGQALNALAESLDDRDGYVRLHAAEVLIRYEQWSYRSLETLLGCLKDKDENVRWLATYSLAELAPESPEAVTALAKAARDPILKVQTGAVYALGEIGPFAKQAAASLHRLADEATQPELQSAILFALQQIEQ